jgi:hypothetical protein
VFDSPREEAVDLLPLADRWMAYQPSVIGWVTSVGLTACRTTR